MPQLVKYCPLKRLTKRMKKDEDLSKGALRRRGRLRLCGPHGGMNVLNELWKRRGVNECI
jgi:hypothetical protein